MTEHRRILQIIPATPGWFAKHQLFQYKGVTYPESLDPIAYWQLVEITDEDGDEPITAVEGVSPLGDSWGGEAEPEAPSFQEYTHEPLGPGRHDGFVVEQRKNRELATELERMSEARLAEVAERQHQWDKRKLAEKLLDRYHWWLVALDERIAAAEPGAETPGEGMFLVDLRKMITDALNGDPAPTKEKPVTITLSTDKPGSSAVRDARVAHVRALVAATMSRTSPYMSLDTDDAQCLLDALDEAQREAESNGKYELRLGENAEACKAILGNDTDGAPLHVLCERMKLERDTLLIHNAKLKRVMMAVRVARQTPPGGQGGASPVRLMANAEMDSAIADLNAWEAQR